ncbi:YicC/YloC family endoribonuclease [Phaeospirillum tilakii]|uniref:YicC/YloC family endoribonuclease n=1 Tax=Phaeospirillum tilakii TaxID=741673 RepID=A0ABW5C521_9PROT
MSVASMTGYARSEGRDQTASWVWEAKSVNGRGLDLRLRLPAGCDALEPAAREAAARRLGRGSIQLGLTLTRQTEAGEMRINTALLTRLADLCRDWQAARPELAPARLDGLLAIRGVVEPAAETEPADDEAGREQRLAAMRAGLDAVLDRLAAMRREEGARIAALLTGQLDLISALTRRAEACAALRPEAIRARFTQQVAALTEAAPSLDPDRVAQEVALLLVKVDVREELDRLAAHVAAARDLLTQGGVIGRKLDFLAQEFNREANTLCSKSADVELTRIGLDLKAVIDQFKEQVQNIE